MGDKDSSGCLQALVFGILFMLVCAFVGVTLTKAAAAGAFKGPLFIKREAPQPAQSYTWQHPDTIAAETNKAIQINTVQTNNQIAMLRSQEDVRQKAKMFDLQLAKEKEEILGKRQTALAEVIGQVIGGPLYLLVIVLAIALVFYLGWKVGATK